MFILSGIYSCLTCRSCRSTKQAKAKQVEESPSLYSSPSQQARMGDLRQRHLPTQSEKTEEPISAPSFTAAPLPRVDHGDFKSPSSGATSSPSVASTPEGFQIKTSEGITFVAATDVASLSEADQETFKITKHPSVAKLLEEMKGGMVALSRGPKRSTLSYLDPHFIYFSIPEDRSIFIYYPQFGTFANFGPSIKKELIAYGKQVTPDLVAEIKDYYLRNHPSMRALIDFGAVRRYDERLGEPYKNLYYDLRFEGNGNASLRFVKRGKEEFQIDLSKDGVMLTPDLVELIQSRMPIWQIKGLDNEAILDTYVKPSSGLVDESAADLANLCHAYPCVEKFYSVFKRRFKGVFRGGDVNKVLNENGVDGCYYFEHKAPYRIYMYIAVRGQPEMNG